MSRCISRSRRTGEQCKRRAAVGVEVCTAHASAATRRRSAEAKARKAAEWVAHRNALPIAVDPVSAVLAEIARCNGLIAFYQSKIDQLEDEALVFGVAKVEEISAGVGREGKNTTYEAGINLWVQLRDAERDRLSRLSLDATRVDLEARRVRLDEQRTRAVVAVLDGALAELGLDPQDRTVAAVVARQIEALGGAL